MELGSKTEENISFDGLRDVVKNGLRDALEKITMLETKQKSINQGQG